jgi:hypothetical protein
MRESDACRVLLIKSRRLARPSLRAACEDNRRPRDLMTVHTAYPYRTLRMWTSGDQPVLDVWLGYTPVDAEQKSNRTFIVLCVRRPKIPGLLELAWPVQAWFTNRVFAEDCEIVEMEQSAYNHQGRDLNQEVFPPIRDLRKLLVESGQLPGVHSARGR